MKIIILAIVLLVGCNPQRKINKAKNILDESGQLAELCLEKFPIKDSVVEKFDTIYIGDVYYDTVYQPCGDTVYKIIVKKEPPKIITKIKEVWKEDSRKLAMLNGELDKAIKSFTDAVNEGVKKDERIAMLEDSVKSWRHVARKRSLWFWLLVGGVIGWTLRKPILKLIKL